MRKLLTLLGILAALMLTSTTAALAAPSGILTASSTGQSAYIDPIVSPGARSAHEHCFYGVKPVNTTESFDSLRDAEHMSTWAVSNNRTALWFPCVYEDGIKLQPFSTKHILLYYKPIAGTECLPGGTKGVSHEYGWRGQIGGGTFYPLPPASSSDGSLVATIFFRGARDFGVACFPTVQAYIRFKTLHGAGPIGNITVGGPVAGVDGAAGPETFHGDYIAAHDPAWAQRFLDNCLIPGKACGTNPAL